jgi:hypothetical protein
MVWQGRRQLFLMIRSCDRDPGSMKTSSTHLTTLSCPSRVCPVLGFRVRDRGYISSNIPPHGYLKTRITPDSQFGWFPERYVVIYPDDLSACLSCNWRVADAEGMAKDLLPVHLCKGDS